tara:strand:- start:274 stop:498 length:225 start_codon:yes stop_codon:yes gene_type:complete
MEVLRSSVKALVIALHKAEAYDSWVSHVKASQSQRMAEREKKKGTKSMWSSQQDVQKSSTQKASYYTSKTTVKH